MPKQSNNGNERRARLDGKSAKHNHDIIVIGASAGGVEALMTVIADLPADLAASVFIVLHISASSPSMLSKILARRGKLPVLEPTDGDPFAPGHIYVACPDHHLMLEPGAIRVVRGPKENLHRPAIDPLFRSAAIAYGPRVIGVILTGALDDGTSGLQAIKQRGGYAIVQDPAEALFPSMPASALRNAKIDYKLELSQMPEILVKLSKEPAANDDSFPVPREIRIESEIASMDNTDPSVMEKLGKPSVYACPDCHGTLWEMEDGDLLRFRCRVGHAFSEESMLAEHNESLESALWAALRALEESLSLSRRMAARAEEGQHKHLAARYRAASGEKEAHVALLRGILENNGKLAMGS